ncbi:hypothetical protein [Nocardia anaemiae]|uniref:hypothetical protein n=1 Tax=Nocardia anaemiae TaxID=263910 RepID=UPI0007A46C9F|nr:hypothetical protein [Nocardia anaemiae]
MTNDQALRIVGGNQLRGTVDLPGTKHGTVLAFAAAIATGATLTLLDAPAITDRFALTEIVRALGGSVTTTDAGLVVDGAITADTVPAEFARRIHGSLYMLPAVVANRGAVTFPGAGGDGLGRFERGLARPMRHMLEVMEAFGARWEWSSDGTVRVRADRLVPATVDLRRWSTDPTSPEGPHVSGASKTALLMAAVAPGTSIVLHPHSREAQHELISILRKLGIEIEQRDACWVVTGATAGTAASHRLMPCPVEFATWQVIAAVTNSTIVARCAETPRLFSAVHRELDFLGGLGIRPSVSPTSVALATANGPYLGRDLVAASTGISTDITPLLALVLNGATSRSTVRDLIWGHRFDYAEQLNRLGAQMTVHDGRLEVNPVPLRPTSQRLTPADTRSAAVCVAAAMSVRGCTVVEGVNHLDRGYGGLVERLCSLGAEVDRITV